MSNEENLEVALRHLLSFPEHLEFYENYTSKREIKSPQDLDEFFVAYKNFLSEKGKWTDEIDLTLKIVKEQSNIVKHQKSTTPIFSINISRKINDSWINEFAKELNSCLTGDVFAEEIKPRQYKTITENLILYDVDTKKLSDLYCKYSSFNHPYVNYQVSSALYNSKNFSQGLPILQDGIKSIASYPIHYWNNEHGVEGAIWMIADFLFLLGNEGFSKLELRQEKIKLLKLLFLYMSRYICMTQSNIKCIDVYSNRARIVRGYYMDFVGIFWLGVNPDIQFISDMYLAYQTAINNHIPIIPPIQQFYWDSMKMYRYGSLIPNNSGGYQDIEDRTWIELVRDGEIRSLMLADNLLKAFENYELNISNADIDKLFTHLSLTKQDDIDNYLKKINERKLKSSDS